MNNLYYYMNLISTIDMKTLEALRTHLNSRITIKALHSKKNPLAITTYTLCKKMNKNALNMITMQKHELKRTFSQKPCIMSFSKTSWTFDTISTIQFTYITYTWVLFTTTHKFIYLINTHSISSQHCLYFYLNLFTQSKS